MHPIWKNYGHKIPKLMATRRQWCRLKMLICWWSQLWGCQAPHGFGLSGISYTPTLLFSSFFLFLGFGGFCSICRMLTREGTSQIIFWSPLDSQVFSKATCPEVDDILKKNESALLNKLSTTCHYLNKGIKSPKKIDPLCFTTKAIVPPFKDLTKAFPSKPLFEVW